LYHAIKAASISDFEPNWHSHSLAEEDEDAQYLDEGLFVPTKPDQTPTFTSKEDFKSKMKGIDKLPKRLQEKVCDLAWKFKHVFEPVRPGCISKYHHEIETTSDRPTKVKQYPLNSEEDNEFVREEIKKLISNGYIEKILSSPYQAPLLVVPKKGTDGQTKRRLCVDYRSLNNITKRDAYQMPSVDSCLRTGKAKIFSKIDLASAFC